MTAPARARALGAARAAAARLAFGPAAPLYELVTDSPPWRADCRALAALLPQGLILDLGVGPGTSAVEMALATPGRRFVGLDRAARMLPRARRRAARAGVALPLLRADALALPFRRASFDGAAGHSVLYLLPDARAALAELRRVVRPGGRVAFLEPREGVADGAGARRDGLRFGAAMALWRVMSALHGRFSQAALTQLLAEAGFEEVSAHPVLRGFGVVAEGRVPAAD